MFKKVLVPLDGSKQAEMILPYVSYLAKGLNVPLVVMIAVDLHAHDIHTKLKAREYVEQVAKRLMEAGLQAESESSMGRPAEEVIPIAERQGCDLIALSSRVEDSAGHGILGGIAMKVLYYSPVPVLLFTPSQAIPEAKQKPAATQLIVPLDGSAFGETALPYAEELARKLSLRVVLVRAIQATPPGYFAEPSSGIPIANLLEAAEAEGAKYLKRVAEDLQHEGIETHSQILKGSPARSIVELAGNTSQSLIIMTSHGQSTLARWLMGSVTEAVVRTSATPVLIIPRQYGRRHALEVTELLSRAPIFSNLTEQDRKSVAQAARIQAYQPGDVIVREGDRSGGLFVIAAGKVEVVKGADAAKPSVLATLGPGGFFGEMAVIGDQPRSATVRALELTECITIKRSDFLAELERHPAIAVRMLPELVRRLREAQDFSAL